MSNNRDKFGRFKKGSPGFTGKHTISARKKMSISRKGKMMGELNPAKRQSVREKISRALTGVSKSAEHVKKCAIARLGLKLSISTRKKMSLSQQKRVKEGRNHLYRGGIADKNRKIRNSIEYRLWREAVFARDNWTCQKTGKIGCILHPHHIKNFAEFPELRFAIDNGITLSEKSHKEFHSKYGIKNNAKEQLDEFLSLSYKR